MENTDFEFALPACQAGFKTPGLETWASVDRACLHVSGGLISFACFFVFFATDLRQLSTLETHLLRPLDRLVVVHNESRQC